MTKITASSKQSEASATSWLHKFRTDQFFRTEFIVAGIFILLCLSNIVIIVVSLKHMHLEVATAVIEIVMEAVALSSLGVVSATTTSELVFQNIDRISTENIAIVIGVSLFVTLLLGFIAARIALTTTRNVLVSQKQFIGNIAHELRTPLSIIHANSEILLLQKHLNNDASTLVKSNIEELHRISGIINNLLTLNSFRNMKTMNFESVDLSGLVRDTLPRFKNLASRKNIILEADLKDGLVIWGNKSGTVQILLNLVNNALVYTPAHGSVFISTYTSPTYVTLEVKDTGIGIDTKNISKIFDPFYQVDSSRSQNKGGGGLGLAIVNEMVKLHQGKIYIQSIPGAGTTVRVDFPAHHTDSTATNLDTSPSELTLDFSKDT